MTHYTDNAYRNFNSLLLYTLILAIINFILNYNLFDREASMRACFREFDRDGSGSIEAKELKEVMKKCGSNLSDAEVTRLVQIIDKDGSGTVSYEEFIAHVFGK